MKDKIAIDDLAEDVFGLNIRGLWSIGTIWVYPTTYFTAAGQSDWGGRYTPSVRLWLSLIALTSLLQFLWIGSDTPLVAAYAEGFRNAGIVPAPGSSFEALGETAALWIYAIAPAAQLALFLFILGFFPFWGEKTTYSFRVRNVFAVMIPSATLLTLFLPAMALIPPTHLTAFGVLIGMCTFGLDAVTAFRGGFKTRSPGGRIWRAGLLALAILVLNVIANICAQITGILVVSFQYGAPAA